MIRFKCLVIFAGVFSISYALETNFTLITLNQEFQLFYSVDRTVWLRLQAIWHKVPINEN